MWAGVVFVLLAGVPAWEAAFPAYQYDTHGHNENSKFYYSYSKEDPAVVPADNTTVVDALTRIKRYREQNVIRAQNPEESQDVKDTLSKIFHGLVPESMKAGRISEYTDIYDYAEKYNVDSPQSNIFSENANDVDVQNLDTTIKVQNWNLNDYNPESTPNEYQQDSTVYDNEDIQPGKDDMKQSSITNIDHSSPTTEVQNLKPNDETQENSVFQHDTSTYSKDDLQAEVRKLIPMTDKMDEVPVDQNALINVHNRSPTIEVQNWSTFADTKEALQVTNTDREEDEFKNESSNRLESLPFSASTESRGARQWSQVSTTTPKYWSPIHRDEDSLQQTNKDKKNDEFKNGQTSKPSESLPLSAWSEPRSAQQWGRVATVTTKYWSPIHGDKETLQETKSYRKEDEFKNVRNFKPLESLPFSAWTESRGAQQWSQVSSVTPKYWSPIHGDDDTLPIVTIDANILTSERLPDIREGKTSADLAGQKTEEPPPTDVTAFNEDNSGDQSSQIDINALIHIIANLTDEYDWNLTDQFNKTLIDRGVPTCPSVPVTTPTTTPSTPETTLAPKPTPFPYNFANTVVVGKCFVCGLKTPQIPHNAFCADAFAGEFLSPVSIDPRARSQITNYKKYCRRLDVHNYVENPSEPRSIYGRFTGGCGVRWADLTGVYTQRTCRAKRPLMGLHFASKRMAKMELALKNVENGCIISPMATLLPMSRGVSLYARFHACVCTGSWCNPAARAQHSLNSAVLVLACWLTHYT